VRALDRLVVEVAEEQLEVLAGAPGIAGAGEHQHPHLRFVLELVEDVAHLEMQLRAHRIALVRPVERDPGDAILALDLHGFVALRHDASHSLSR
jgi:hypothetical protein